jgi:hypothetical protein
MKSVIHLFTAVLALTVVQQASADLTIRLTGSTAFRAGTHKGIVSMMGGAANCKFAMAGLTATVPAATQGGYEGADHTVIQGPVAGIGTLTVQCTWTGSATGIKDVAEGNNLNFIPVSSLPATNGYAAAAPVLPSPRNRPPPSLPSRMCSRPPRLRPHLSLMTTNSPSSPSLGWPMKAPQASPT